MMSVFEDEDDEDCGYELPSAGGLVAIVGIEAKDRDRSCELHPGGCGIAVLSIGALVRFRQVWITIWRKEEMAIAVYWVSGGKDCCRVGFLPRDHIKHHAYYEGKLAQIVEFCHNSSDKNKVDFAMNNWGACGAVLLE
jgi:hypothetical protein